MLIDRIADAVRTSECLVPNRLNQSPLEIGRCEGESEVLIELSVAGEKYSRTYYSSWIDGSN